MSFAAPLAIAAGAVVLRVIAGVGFANYDTLYALAWGGQLARGQTPAYRVAIAPTPHPRAGQTMTCARIAYYPLQQGDLVRILTGRGGGYGPPFQRPAERVAEDVRNGYVTREAAEREYGVVVDQDFNVDDAATQR